MGSRFRYKPINKYSENSDNSTDKGGLTSARQLLFPTPVLALQQPNVLCSFFKCFFVLVYVIFVQYINIANVAQRTLEFVQKSSSREYN